MRNIGFARLAIFRPGIIVGRSYPGLGKFVGKRRAWAVRQYRSANHRSLNRRRDRFAQSRDRRSYSRKCSNEKTRCTVQSLACDFHLSLNELIAKDKTR